MSKILNGEKKRNPDKLKLKKKWIQKKKNWIWEKNINELHRALKVLAIITNKKKVWDIFTVDSLTSKCIT